MAYSPVTGASFSGGPYFGAAKVGAPVRNNGATILLGGNASPASSYGVSGPIPVSQVLGSAYLGYRSGINGSITPLNPRGEGVSKALANGTYSAMVPGAYIGMLYPNGQIAGIANTLLAGGASYSSRRSENSYTGSVRTQQYIMTGGWNYTTGQPINRLDKTDIIPNEVAPTMAIPGKLTYMITGTTAKVDVYKAKTD